jgi:outer membrane protein insertion porin family
LELGIEHVAQDTTYSTTGITGGIRVKAGRKVSFALGASKERTAVAGAREGQAVKRSRIAARAGVEINGTDDPFAPRSGFKISGTGDFGSRKDTDTASGESLSWRITNLDVAGELHKRLSRRHGIFFGARWRKVISDEDALPWDQLLRFGGASSLRGYREGQFRAEETGLAQLESRVAIGDGGSRLFVFSDFGVLRGQGAPKRTLIGYGLGIRAITPSGVVGLDYGLGSGDSWSEGKVHVRLTRTF